MSAIDFGSSGQGSPATAMRPVAVSAAFRRPARMVAALSGLFGVAVLVFPPLLAGTVRVSVSPGSIVDWLDLLAAITIGQVWGSPFDLGIEYATARIVSLVLIGLAVAAVVWLHPDQGAGDARQGDGRS